MRARAQRAAVHAWQRGARITETCGSFDQRAQAQGDMVDPWRRGLDRWLPPAWRSSRPPRSRPAVIPRGLIRLLSRLRPDLRAGQSRRPGSCQFDSRLVNSSLARLRDREHRALCGPPCAGVNCLESSCSALTWRRRRSCGGLPGRSKTQRVVTPWCRSIRRAGSFGGFRLRLHARASRRRDRRRECAEWPAGRPRTSVRLG